MPTPAELKTAGKSAAIFCYTEDLVPAAKVLRDLLVGCGCAVTYTRVYLTTQGDVDSIGDDDPPQSPDVAWLVGHGLAGDNHLGTGTHSRYIDLTKVLGFLPQTTLVVDTGCQTNQRKAIGKSNHTYYCVPDDHNTSVIIGQQLDDWWDANNFAEQ